MYDDEYDEYRREKQLLMAEREDEQTRVLMAAVFGDDEDDGEEIEPFQDESIEEDFDEGPGITEDDDPDELPPAQRDGPLTVATPEPVVETPVAGPIEAPPEPMPTMPARVGPRRRQIHNKTAKGKARSKPKDPSKAKKATTKKKSKKH